ncbi:MAG: single-stranded DNA-binding protein [Bacteroidales bacterium]|nr:single-stranded DNA-binding protein [Candidatus Cacconaster merdequi]
MQNIEIIGNLAQDASMVQSKNGGDPFMSFKVICNEKKGDAEVKTVYEVTGKSSGVFQFLKQGKRVFVSGMPSARAYQSKDGNLMAQIVIRVHNLELL